MLSDDELRAMRSDARHSPEAEHTVWWMLLARAVEQATYEAAIKAIEATKIDEDDLVEEIDREVNRTIDGCVDAIRSLMEQPK